MASLTPTNAHITRMGKAGEFPLQRVVVGKPPAVTVERHEAAVDNFGSKRESASSRLEVLWPTSSASILPRFRVLSIANSLGFSHHVRVLQRVAVNECRGRPHDASLDAGSCVESGAGCVVGLCRAGAGQAVEVGERGPQ